MACHCRYSISKLPYPRMAKAISNSTKYQLKKRCLFTIIQLYPRNPKSTLFAMSENVSKTNASHRYQQRSTKTHSMTSSVRTGIQRTAQTKRSAPRASRSYLKLPYISERLNHGITNIFRKENIPIRSAHRPHTLRRALSHNSTERTCTMDKRSFPTPNCVYEETPSTRSRVTTAMNNTSVALHASFTIV